MLQSLKGARGQGFHTADSLVLRPKKKKKENVGSACNFKQLRVIWIRPKLWYFKAKWKERTVRVFAACAVRHKHNWTRLTALKNGRVTTMTTTKHSEPYVKGNLHMIRPAYWTCNKATRGTAVKNVLPQKNIFPSTATEKYKNTSNDRAGQLWLETHGKTLYHRYCSCVHVVIFFFNCKGQIIKKNKS